MKSSQRHLSIDILTWIRNSTCATTNTRVCGGCLPSLKTTASRKGRQMQHTRVMAVAQLDLRVQVSLSVERSLARLFHIDVF